LISIFKMTAYSKPTDAERIAACFAMLERRCREVGTWISGDGRVGEDAAAALLGWAPGTMANRRLEGSAPPHYRLGGNGHRVTYSLRDLAEWIERRRCE
jgi:hypothetical protein